jgi:hypothetical protein
VRARTRRAFASFVTMGRFALRLGGMAFCTRELMLAEEGREPCCTAPEAAGLAMLANPRAGADVLEPLRVLPLPPPPPDNPESLTDFFTMPLALPAFLLRAEAVSANDEMVSLFKSSPTSFAPRISVSVPLDPPQSHAFLAPFFVASHAEDQEDRPDDVPCRPSSFMTTVEAKK